MSEIVAQPKAKARVKIDPANDPGGELQQLLIANKQAADKAAEAGEEADKYKAAIKGYLLGLFENPEDLPAAFDISADPHGRYPGYTMTLKGLDSVRLDTAALKDGDPDMYAKYSKPVTPAWELRESQQGRRRK